MGIQHILFCINKSLSFIDEMITCTFLLCFQGCVLSCLMIWGADLWWKCKLKWVYNYSLTPQHFQEERQTGCTHSALYYCSDMKNGSSRASAGAYVYFWGGYNSKRSRMRCRLSYRYFGSHLLSLALSQALLMCN